MFSRNGKTLYQSYFGSCGLTPVVSTAISITAITAIAVSTAVSVSSIAVPWCSFGISLSRSLATIINTISKTVSTITAITVSAVSTAISITTISVPWCSFGNSGGFGFRFGISSSLATIITSISAVSTAISIISLRGNHGGAKEKESKNTLHIDCEKLLICNRRPH